MAIYLQTRSRTTDYAFLGDAPQERWWTAFERRTTLERPTIIIEAFEGRLRGYFSGIQSPSRRDRVGTVIRYTIVVEDEPKTILALACACLMPDALDSAIGLGRLLDNQFVSEDEVDDLLKGGAVAGERVSRRVAEAVQSFQALSAGEADVQQAGHLHWFGCVASEAARRIFMDRVKQLSSRNVSGLAARLNLVGTEEACGMGSGYQSMALLIESDGKIERQGLVELNPQTPAPLPPAAAAITTAKTQRSDWSFSGRSWVLVVVLVGLSVLVAAIFVGRPTSTPAATSSAVGNSAR
ncbi:hypothetical protein AzCIB_1360 [Azoarcus sp. CIB]|uniref:hypothetical protein n=1 Tax=Aromatoleum sp. (strain CIB) TaxID=198107 RepID=UPI0006A2750E|nr:hypothetical protein [Azoarcus sp. CIB]AKU11265.1 hypothetical protein AzCIB_1360 [Azoarcus sp. CIB]